MFYPYDKNEYDKVFAEIDTFVKPRINGSYEQALELKRAKLAEFLNELQSKRTKKEEKSC